MAKDLNINPYYATHVDEYAKDYKVVMFRPNRAVQARELTETQTLAHEQLKTNFDSLYKNGSIVEGCNLTITTGTTVTCDMSYGKFYFDGRVLSVPAQQIVISGSGDENIGLYVEEEFIASTADSTLVDPASGFPGSNYGLPGADRLKITVQLVKVMPVVTPRVTLPSYQKYEDENNLTSIWNLTDGVVQNYIRKPDYSLLTQTLAQRTYDESGNYLVEGMKLSTAQSSETGKIKVVVDPGTCYVKGYGTTFIVPRAIDVSKALTTDQHQNEPHTFATGTLFYNLNNPYVVIDELVHDVEITAQVDKTIMITRGSGDYDAFEDAYGTVYESIGSIISIYGYVSGVDYELSSDRVHWLSGSRPGLGVDYSCQFRYYKQCVRDTDFEVLEDPYSDSNIYTIHWLSSGDNPANTTSFLVDYYSYLARTDLIGIDKFGSIIAKSGVPTDYDKTVIPPYNEELLPLGWVKFMPGMDYDSCITYEYQFKRTTMFELYYLKKRVNDLEENVAALALETEAKEGEESITLKGMLVDPFNTLYKADISHPDYYAATNLIEGQLFMASSQLHIDFNRTLDTKTNIDVLTDAGGYSKFITLDQTAEVAFFQNLLKSDTMNLNPHGFIKQSPNASLNPASDSWISTEVREKVIIENVVEETITASHQLQWVSTPTDTTQFIEEKTRSIGEKVGYEKVEIGERLQTFARVKSIGVKGRNFESASILTAVFGGFYVALTAVSPYRNQTVSGTPTGKIIVAADGTFEASFTIPTGVKSGDIELRLQDEHGNIFTTIYRSRGVTKIIENRTVITKQQQKIIDVYDIITPTKNDPITPPDPPATITTPTPEKSWERRIPDREEILRDPLAQSFIFKTDKILRAIDFFFGTKADDLPKPVVPDDYYNTAAFQPTIPAILTIGYMKNGFPDAENVLYMQEIQPSEITTSPYGTIPTHIVLNKPIYIPAMRDFYISIGSKSTEYTLFVSVLGATDLDSGNIIMKNPYQDGVLFTSSNGITWSAVQDRDMTIVLYEGTYAATGSFVTENIAFPYSTWTGFGRFLFMNEFNEIPGTGIQFYYSIDGGTTWKVFNPAEEINIDAQATQFRIKCEMTANTDANLTPIVNFQTNLVIMKYDNTRTNQYRTKIVEGVPAYNNNKLIVDEQALGSTNIIKEFSSDDGVTWFRFCFSPTETSDAGKNYTRNTYVFDFLLLQRLTVSTVTGFAVGDNVKVTGDPANRGKIVAIDTTNKYIWTHLNDDGETPFAGSSELSNGTATANITATYEYTSEPTWPTTWIGRLILESTNYWKSPSVMNYRSIMKAL